MIGQSIRLVLKTFQNDLVLSQLIDLLVIWTDKRHVLFQSFIIHKQRMIIVLQKIGNERLIFYAHLFL